MNKMLVTIIFAINIKTQYGIKKKKKKNGTMALHLQNTWLQELKCPFCGTFDLGSARVFLLPHWRHISTIIKIYRLLQQISICIYFLTVI